MRRTPSADAAISARMSPTFCSGKRELRKKIRSAASLVTPASISLVGGTMMPSWKMSVVSGLIEPGAHAADVGEMRPAHHEAAAPAFMEHRRQQHLVVGVRDRAARAVAVVVPVEVARPHRLGREVARRPGR